MPRAKTCEAEVQSGRSHLGATGYGSPAPPEVNEGWFLHGTKPETVLQILSHGLSERMCGGKFGKGVYLAEDPEKADQYATPDSKYCSEGLLADLHRRLYRKGSRTRHPGEDLFYMFVVRAVGGIPTLTKDGEKDMDRPLQNVFASAEKRDLSEVPGVTPPMRFHSLVVELGDKIKRFREFVHFDSSRLIVEHLVAYKRVG